MVKRIMKLNCQVRQASSNVDAKHYDTERLRKEYLVENVMVPDEINMVYSMFDRIIAGGAVPVKEELLLSAPDILRADWFTQRREVGIINVGGPGTVVVGEESYHLEHKEALYVGRGNRHIVFKSDAAEAPSHFYFCSATAHRETGVKKVSKKDAVVMHLGSLEESNERTINRLLVKEVVPCCQL
jgi:4-deoxy-L-threo-5-hexosulose-uronate ketol-isomerase